jgi:hypothetical protein
MVLIGLIIITAVPRIWRMLPVPAASRRAGAGSALIAGR